MFSTPTQWSEYCRKNAARPPSTKGPGLLGKTPCAAEPSPQGESRVTVRFEGHHDQWAAVYEARLIKETTNVA